MTLPLRSSHQLVDFLTAVSDHQDADGATAAAAEMAAGEFDAEIGAVLIGNALAAAVGFGSAPAPAAELVHAQAGGSELELSGLGRRHLATASWDGDRPGSLLVARLDAPFDADERNLLQGMARVLGLALRGVAALETERHWAPSASAGRASASDCSPRCASAIACSRSCSTSSGRSRTASRCPRC